MFRIFEQTEIKYHTNSWRWCSLNVCAISKCTIYKWSQYLVVERIWFEHRDKARCRIPARSHHIRTSLWPVFDRRRPRISIWSQINRLADKATQYRKSNSKAKNKSTREVSWCWWTYAGARNGDPTLWGWIFFSCEYSINQRLVIGCAQRLVKVLQSPWCVSATRGPKSAAHLVNWPPKNFASAGKICRSGGEVDVYSKVPHPSAHGELLENGQRIYIYSLAATFLYGPAAQRIAAIERSSNDSAQN